MQRGKKVEDSTYIKEQTFEITVIITVYNTAIEFVKRAIRSVIAQDYQNFEIILIDDGSNINTQRQLLSFIKHTTEEIIYIRHSNRGQSQSIKRGILNSKGKYIAILDADDEYQTNHLSGCIKEIKNHDLIASTTETIVDREEDYFVPDKFNTNKLIHVDDCILFATLFGKKEVFETIGFENKYGADAHFYEQAQKQFKVKKLDLRTYTYYRNNPNSICSVLKREAQLLN